MSRKVIAEQILDILEDGEPHNRDELKKLVAPSNPHCLFAHITGARKRLPEDHMIVCRFIQRRLWYQRVIRYKSPKS